jgi:Ser/Thr protein kinase RdoA (MazF antagonist)
MKLDPTIREYEVLQGGISGAATYRVHVAGRHVILKIVDAGSPPALLERAEREIDFYRALSDRIPLRVPAIVGISTDASAYGLCLRAYRPAMAVETWNERYYTELAQELGRFHATFWNRTDQLSHLQSLRKHTWSSDSSTLLEAAAWWRSLLQRPRSRTEVSPHELSWIDQSLSRLDELEPVYTSLSTTLRHGDCHHANLLLDDDGETVWADWQEVGIGLGPEDLSFLFQRARAEGSFVPEDAVIEAYYQSLQAAVGSTIDLQVLRRVVDASEFRSLLLLWPPFLAGASAQQLSGAVCRLHYLEGKLGL